VYEDELAFAADLADRADAISMSYFRGSFRVGRKGDGTPVTEADLAVEEELRKALVERFPGDAVLGEEHGLDGAGGRTWVLDPIDGTKNFAAGIQIWGTLIALAEGGLPVLGVITAPALGERYAAARGMGATLNGAPIRVSSVDRIRDGFLTFSSLDEWQNGPRRDAFASLVREARRTRGFGDFWGHALVARGACDAMLETSLRTWDWTAIQAIVEEAGGRVTQLDGSPLADRGSTLTSNGLLHDELVARLRSGLP
jgi:histidinol-phosphatase